MRTARLRQWLAAAVLAGALGGVCPGAWGQQHAIRPACEVLAGLKLSHATITSAQSTATETIPGGLSSATPIEVPARCVVKLVSRPTPDSEIGIELWLPLNGWNGRYMQVGNGGWSGAVLTPALAFAVQRGFAAAGTDDGHSGSMAGGAQWAVGHPEKVIDFSYRAVHETALLAHQIVNAFYSNDAARSYFVGCSTGGRQALMEAQRFPEDFDGIIAGAPANNMSHLQAAGVWNEQALLKSRGQRHSARASCAVIQRAALAACDRLDGLRDGLIQDPRACHFNPTVLKCKDKDGPKCLTGPQVAALRKLYAGPSNPRTRRADLPGTATGH